MIILLFFLFENIICTEDMFSFNRHSGGIIQKEIERINFMQKSWTAGFNYISSMNDAEVRKKLGIIIRPEMYVSAVHQWMNVTHDFKTNKIPERFDVRKAWPKCKVARYIPDQSVCGSCWAVATAAAFSVGLCVASKQTIDKHLSAEDILTCCKKCIHGNGCQGGSLEKAFGFLIEYGICTGGTYGSQDGCKPYSIAPCVPTKNNSCDYKVRAESCQLKCTNQKYRKSFWKDKHYSKNVIQIYNHTEAVQKIMLHHGSVVAVFKMFEDFKHYKSGVYFHVLGKFLGWHAVRLLGWGTENDVNYWIGANSWNLSWGDHGTIKINRDQNFCDFNYFMTSIPVL